MISAGRAKQLHWRGRQTDGQTDTVLLHRRLPLNAVSQHGTLLDNLVWDCARSANEKGNFVRFRLGLNPDECKDGCSYKVSVRCRCGSWTNYFGHLFIAVVVYAINKAIEDIKLCPRSGTAPWLLKFEFTPFSRCLFHAIVCRHNVIQKTRST